MIRRSSAAVMCFRLAVVLAVLAIGPLNPVHATAIGEPFVIKPICTGTFGCTEISFSLTPAGEKLFFLGYELEHGLELWISDGSEAGTHLVKDIVPGPSGLRICAFCSLSRIAYGDLLLFQNYSWEGTYSLWVSDGTEEGTQHVKDLDSFSLIDFNGLPVLIASATDTYQIYTTDGTSDGTNLVKTIQLGGVSHVTTYVDDVYLYILFSIPVSGENEPFLGILWRTDGTPEGTIQLVEIPNLNPYSISNWASLNDSAFFMSNYTPESDPVITVSTLWGSDGTPEDTQAIAVFPYQSAMPIRNITATEDLLFFGARREGESPVLWQSDGTVSGTVSVEDSGGPYSPANLTPYQGKLFFSSADPVSAYYTTTGSSGGITHFADLVLNNELFWRSPVVAGDALYYLNSDGEGNDVLWRTDGAQTLALVNGAAPYTEPYFELANRRDIYFSAITSETGRELWGSRGSPESTRLLGDLTPGSGSFSPSGLVLAGDLVYFTLLDSNWDVYLWVIDPYARVYLPLVRK